MRDSGTGQDYSRVDLRKLEAALHEVEERYRNLVESTHDLIWTFDLELQPTFYSPSIEGFLGYTPQEALQLPLDRILSPEAFQQVDRLREEAVRADRKGRLRSRASETLQLEHRRRDGSAVWGEVQATAMQDTEGRLVGFHGVTRDMTERLQHMRERERLIAELESRNNELERYAYSVSHDLKSPLITINGFLGLLEEEVEQGDPASLRASIRRIATAVDTMAGRLEELLQLSRVGRQLGPLETVSMRALAEEVIQLVAGRLENARVDIRIDPSLPDTLGDSSRLQEVLQNLVENAAKFLGSQPEPWIRIGSRAEGEETVYFVQDNGVGIEPRDHQRIFELFDQLEPDGEGSGAGLCLAKRIVEAHGGRIWVESEGQGRGSTFCFTLAAT